MLVAITVAADGGVRAAGPATRDPLGGQVQDGPIRSGLEERTTTTLRQIEITVTGPAERIGTITAGDIELHVGPEWIDKFELDDFCDPRPVETAGGRPGQPVAAPAGAVPADATAARRPLNVVFYWDSQLSSFAGRNESLRTLRGLVRDLVRDGDRGALVADGIELIGVTTDAQALLDGIDRIDGDVRFFNPWWADECGRWGRTGAELNSFVRQEQTMMERSLSQLAYYAVRMFDMEHPKIIVYFADRLRRQGGAHYYQFLGQPAPVLSDVFHRMETVLGQITAQGVRVYPAYSEGMAAAPNDGIDCPRGAPGFDGGKADIEDTLMSLAAETGGRAFIRSAATDVEQIVETIETDASCRYLISFDARYLEQNRGLPVKLVLRRDLDPARRRQLDGVSFRTPGRMTVESADVRRVRTIETSLLAAPDDASQGDLGIGFLPLGFEGKTYRVKAQVFVRPIGFSEATYDVALTVLSGGHVKSLKVADQRSGRIITRGRPGPVVFERELRLRPGVSEVRAVVAAGQYRPGDEESGTDASLHQVSSARTTIELPEIDRPAAVGPIAVSQVVRAGFASQGEADSVVAEDVSRPLAFPPATALRGERATAFDYLVCTKRPKRARLAVRASVVDLTVAVAEPERHRFDPTEVVFPDSDKQRRNAEHCVRMQSVVPPVAGFGRYRFEVEVDDAASGERLADRSTVYDLVDTTLFDEPASASAASAGLDTAQ